GPSFDVAGWFARDAAVLEKVGRVLLADRNKAATPKRLLVARDAFAMVEGAVARALAPALGWLKKVIGASEEIEVAPEGLVSWCEAFRTLQAAEVWASVGGWVRQVKPTLGPGVKERIAWAAKVTPRMVAQANRQRSKARTRLQQLMAPQDVLCLPTS